MTWREKFSIGVPHIDSQHQALFSGMERIYSILADHDDMRDRRMTEDAVYFLEQHAVKHFADEEAYMLSIQDGNFRLHKAQHDAILEELGKKKEEIVTSDFSARAIRKLLGTLLSWLTYHTLEVDQLIGKTIASPGELNFAVTALERAITQVMTDMLQITPELVDADYSGQPYGSELFCTVSGSVSPRETLHILFVADLQVIEQAVSRLLGIPVTETDELVLSAFEELCRVLSIHFVKEFRDHTFFDIRDSRVAEQETSLPPLPEAAPLCSTLFNDPYGSFCIRIWQEP